MFDRVISPGGGSPPESFRVGRARLLLSDMGSVATTTTAPTTSTTLAMRSRAQDSHAVVRRTCGATTSQQRRRHGTARQLDVQYLYVTKGDCNREYVQWGILQVANSNDVSRRATLPAWAGCGEPGIEPFWSNDFNVQRVFTRNYIMSHNGSGGTVYKHVWNNSRRARASPRSNGLHKKPLHQLQPNAGQAGTRADDEHAREHQRHPRRARLGGEARGRNTTGCDGRRWRLDGTRSRSLAGCTGFPRRTGRTRVTTARSGT